MPNGVLGFFVDDHDAYALRVVARVVGLSLKPDLKPRLNLDDISPIRNAFCNSS